LGRAAPLGSGRPVPAGFTLVEVLVALFVLAIIASMGWQAVSAMANTREHTQAASERTLRLQTIMAQWAEDLHQVYDAPQVPGLHFDGAALRLVRRQGDGVQVVAWALRQGQWTRWASPAVQQQQQLQQWWLTSMQLTGTEPGHLLLTDGALDWQIYFYRGRAWTNAQSSGDLADAEDAADAAEADSGTSGNAADGNPSDGNANAPPAAAAPPRPNNARERLPTGVRLRLDLPEGAIHRDVPLPARRP
jgi:general secretion pathway protein J